jgi:hypothetical protein
MGNGKYEWVHLDFSKWLRDQIQMIKEQGHDNIGTKSITKMLVDDLLIPNKIIMKMPKFIIEKEKK